MVKAGQQRWVNWDPFAKSRTIDEYRALGMACVLSCLQVEIFVI